jgi:type IV fimbrial biogenesis protein FimT
MDHEEGGLVLNRCRGFSLIELLVAIALGSLLMALAMPNFTTWVNNARVRSVADALQAGLRTSQAEAQRRAHTVVFFRTTSKSCDTTSVANASGQAWQIRTVPNALMSNDVAEAVRCGVLTDVSSGVSLSGPATVCFSGDGRQTASTDPAAVGIDCTLDAQGRPSTFDVTTSSATAETRPLRILVTLGGAVRMCDPKKTLSTSTPDGCPP